MHNEHCEKRIKFKQSSIKRVPIVGNLGNLMYFDQILMKILIEVLNNLYTSLYFKFNMILSSQKINCFYKFNLLFIQ